MGKTKTGNGDLERKSKRTAAEIMKTVKKNFNVALAMKGKTLTDVCKEAGIEVSHVSRALTAKNTTLTTLNKLAIVADVTFEKLVIPRGDENA